MAESMEQTSEQARCEIRKNQLLDAAATCFGANGFHGASIAQISKAAGMSAGHIYHYFENKEAIIAAIVERDLDRLLGLNAEISSAINPLQAFLDQVDLELQKMFEHGIVALKLEIVAEASRNAHIARIVQVADRRCLSSLSETVRLIRRSCGHDDDEVRIAGLTELLAAMFEGLMIRSIRNPDFDRMLTSAAFLRAIRDLIAETPDKLALQ